MFSKNKDNKHKSLHSKQFSAFNAKKIKREILRQILLTLHAAGQTWDSGVGSCRGPGGGLASLCPARPALCTAAEAAGVLLSGGYTQTHPRLCGLYTYVHRGRLLFLCGNRQLHLGKLDADLRPAVIAGGRGQSGLLRGQRHPAPL